MTDFLLFEQQQSLNRAIEIAPLQGEPFRVHFGLPRDDFIPPPRELDYGAQQNTPQKGFRVTLRWLIERYEQYQRFLLNDPEGGELFDEIDFGNVEAKAKFFKEIEEEQRRINRDYNLPGLQSLITSYSLNTETNQQYFWTFQRFSTKTVTVNSDSTQPISNAIDDVATIGDEIVLHEEEEHEKEISNEGQNAEFIEDRVPETNIDPRPPTAVEPLSGIDYTSDTSSGREVLVRAATFGSLQTNQITMLNDDGSRGELLDNRTGIINVERQPSLQKEELRLNEQRTLLEGTLDTRDFIRFMSEGVIFLKELSNEEALKLLRVQLDVLENIEANFDRVFDFQNKLSLLVPSAHNAHTGVWKLYRVDRSSLRRNARIEGRGKKDRRTWKLLVRAHVWVREVREYSYKRQNKMARLQINPIARQAFGFDSRYYRILKYTLPSAEAEQRALRALNRRIRRYVEYLVLDGRSQVSGNPVPYVLDPSLLSKKEARSILDYALSVKSVIARVESFNNTISDLGTQIRVTQELLDAANLSTASDAQIRRRTLQERIDLLQNQKREREQELERFAQEQKIERNFEQLEWMQWNDNYPVGVATIRQVDFQDVRKNAQLRLAIDISNALAGVNPYKSPINDRDWRMPLPDEVVNVADKSIEYKSFRSVMDVLDRTLFLDPVRANPRRNENSELRATRDPSNPFYNLYMALYLEYQVKYVDEPMRVLDYVIDSESQSASPLWTLAKQTQVANTLVELLSASSKLEFLKRGKFDTANMFALSTNSNEYERIMTVLANRPRNFTLNVGARVEYDAEVLSVHKLRFPTDSGTYLFQQFNKLDKKYTMRGVHALTVFDRNVANIQKYAPSEHLRGILNPTSAAHPYSVKINISRAADAATATSNEIENIPLPVYKHRVHGRQLVPHQRIGVYWYYLPQRNLVWLYSQLKDDAQVLQEDRERYSTEEHLKPLWNREDFILQQIQFDNESYFPLRNITSKIDGLYFCIEQFSLKTYVDTPWFSLFNTEKAFNIKNKRLDALRMPVTLPARRNIVIPRDFDTVPPSRLDEVERMLVQPFVPASLIAVFEINVLPTVQRQRVMFGQTLFLDARPMIDVEDGDLVVSVEWYKQPTEHSGVGEAVRLRKSITLSDDEITRAIAFGTLLRISERIVESNGFLFLQNVDFTDQGVYVCRVETVYFDRISRRAFRERVVADLQFVLDIDMPESAALDIHTEKSNVVAEPIKKNESYSSSTKVVKKQSGSDTQLCARCLQRYKVSDNNDDACKWHSHPLMQESIESHQYRDRQTYAGDRFLYFLIQKSYILKKYIESQGRGSLLQVPFVKFLRLAEQESRRMWSASRTMQVYVLEALARLDQVRDHLRQKHHVLPKDIRDKFQNGEAYEYFVNERLTLADVEKLTQQKLADLLVLERAGAIEDATRSTSMLLTNHDIESSPIGDNLPLNISISPTNSTSNGSIRSRYVPDGEKSFVGNPMIFYGVRKTKSMGTQSSPSHKRQWRCCGQDVSYPGCWTGRHTPIKSDPDLFDAFSTLETDNVWLYNIEAARDSNKYGAVKGFRSGFVYGEEGHFRPSQYVFVQDDKVTRAQVGSRWNGVQPNMWERRAEREWRTLLPRLSDRTTMRNSFYGGSDEAFAYEVLKREFIMNRILGARVQFAWQNFFDYVEHMLRAKNDSERILYRSSAQLKRLRSSFFRPLSDNITGEGVKIIHIQQAIVDFMQGRWADYGNEQPRMDRISEGIQASTTEERLVLHDLKTLAYHLYLNLFSASQNISNASSLFKIPDNVRSERQFATMKKIASALLSGENEVSVFSNVWQYNLPRFSVWYIDPALCRSPWYSAVGDTTLVESVLANDVSQEHVRHLMQAAKSVAHAREQLQNYITLNPAVNSVLAAAQNIDIEDDEVKEIFGKIDALVQQFNARISGDIATISNVEAQLITLQNILSNQGNAAIQYFIDQNVEKKYGATLKTRMEALQDIYSTQLNAVANAKQEIDKEQTNFNDELNGLQTLLRAGKFATRFPTSSQQLIEAKRILETLEKSAQRAILIADLYDPPTEYMDPYQIEQNRFLDELAQERLAAERFVRERNEYADDIDRQVNQVILNVVRRAADQREMPRNLPLLYALDEMLYEETDAASAGQTSPQLKAQLQNLSNDVNNAQRYFYAPVYQTLDENPALQKVLAEMHDFVDEYPLNVEVREQIFGKDASSLVVTTNAQGEKQAVSTAELRDTLEEVRSILDRNVESGLAEKLTVTLINKHLIQTSSSSSGSGARNAATIRTLQPEEFKTVKTKLQQDVLSVFDTMRARADSVADNVNNNMLSALVTRTKDYDVSQVPLNASASALRSLVQDEIAKTARAIDFATKKLDEFNNEKNKELQKAPLFGPVKSQLTQFLQLSNTLLEQLKQVQTKLKIDSLPAAQQVLENEKLSKKLAQGTLQSLLVLQWNGVKFDRSIDALVKRETDVILQNARGRQSTLQQIESLISKLDESLTKNIFDLSTQAFGFLEQDKSHNKIRVLTDFSNALANDIDIQTEDRQTLIPLQAAIDKYQLGLNAAVAELQQSGSPTISDEMRTRLTSNAQKAAEEIEALLQNAFMTIFVSKQLFASIKKFVLSESARAKQFRLAFQASELLYLLENVESRVQHFTLTDDVNRSLKNSAVVAQLVNSELDARAKKSGGEKLGAILFDSKKQNITSLAELDQQIDAQQYTLLMLLKELSEGRKDTFFMLHGAFVEQIKAELREALKIGTGEGKKSPFQEKLLLSTTRILTSIQTITNSAVPFRNTASLSVEDLKKIQGTEVYQEYKRQLTTIDATPIINSELNSFIEKKYDRYQKFIVEELAALDVSLAPYTRTKQTLLLGERTLPFTFLENLAVESEQRRTRLMSQQIRALNEFARLDVGGRNEFLRGELKLSTSLPQIDGYNYKDEQEKLYSYVYTRNQPIVTDNAATIYNALGEYYENLFSLRATEDFLQSNLFRILLVFMHVSLRKVYYYDNNNNNNNNNRIRNAINERDYKMLATNNQAVKNVQIFTWQYVDNDQRTSVSDIINVKTSAFEERTCKQSFEFLRDEIQTRFLNTTRREKLEPWLEELRRADRVFRNKNGRFFVDQYVGEILMNGSFSTYGKILSENFSRNFRGERSLENYVNTLYNYTILFLQQLQHRQQLAERPKSEWFTIVRGACTSLATVNYVNQFYLKELKPALLTSPFQSTIANLPFDVHLACTILGRNLNKNWLFDFDVSRNLRIQRAALYAFGQQQKDQPLPLVRITIEDINNYAYNVSVTTKIITRETDNDEDRAKQFIQHFIIDAGVTRFLIEERQQQEKEKEKKIGELTFVLKDASISSLSSPWTIVVPTTGQVQRDIIKQSPLELASSVAKGTSALWLQSVLLLQVAKRVHEQNWFSGLLRRPTLMRQMNDPLQQTLAKAGRFQQKDADDKNYVRFYLPLLNTIGDQQGRRASLTDLEQYPLQYETPEFIERQLWIVYHNILTRQIIVLDNAHSAWKEVEDRQDVVDAYTSTLQEAGFKSELDTMKILQEVLRKRTRASLRVLSENSKQNFPLQTTTGELDFLFEESLAFALRLPNAPSTGKQFVSQYALVSSSDTDLAFIVDDDDFVPINDKIIRKAREEVRNEREILENVQIAKRRFKNPEFQVINNMAERLRKGDFVVDMIYNFYEVKNDKLQKLGRVRSKQSAEDFLKNAVDDAFVRPISSTVLKLTFYKLYEDAAISSRPLDKVLVTSFIDAYLKQISLHNAVREISLYSIFMYDLIRLEWLQQGRVSATTSDEEIRTLLTSKEKSRDAHISIDELLDRLIQVVQQANVASLDKAVEVLSQSQLKIPGIDVQVSLRNYVLALYNTVLFTLGRLTLADQVDDLIVNPDQFGRPINSLFITDTSTSSASASVLTWRNFFSAFGFEYSPSTATATAAAAAVAGEQTRRDQINQQLKNLIVSETKDPQTKLDIVKFKSSEVLGTRADQSTAWNSPTTVQDGLVYFDRLLDLFAFAQEQSVSGSAKKEESPLQNTLSKFVGLRNSILEKDETKPSIESLYLKNVYEIAAQMRKVSSGAVRVQSISNTELADEVQLRFGFSLPTQKQRGRRRNVLTEAERSFLLRVHSWHMSNERSLDSLLLSASPTRLKSLITPSNTDFATSILNWLTKWQTDSTKDKQNADQNVAIDTRKPYQSVPFIGSLLFVEPKKLQASNTKSLEKFILQQQVPLFLQTYSKKFELVESIAKLLAVQESV